MNLHWLTQLICLALCLCRQRASADLPSASDAASVAHWIVSQQCTNSNLPSCGGVKSSPEPVAFGPDGKPYCCITPYYANLAVLALLRTQAPDSVHTADLWIRWYFAHLNPLAAPDGVPCDHFCHSDGEGETNCVKPGDALLCRHNDATDSAAATFFSVLWAAHQAGLPMNRSAEHFSASTSPASRRAMLGAPLPGSSPLRFPASALAIPEWKQQVETLAGVLLKLQQPDGLCWAKADYHVKYLEDNCEVFAGLRDLADLEREVFNEPQQSSVYRQAAEWVQRGIVSELYDRQAKLFLIAKFENGKRPATNLDKWYPDTQAQSWPLLFGVCTANDPMTHAAISAVNEHWNGHGKPDWASEPDAVNEGWLEAADAYAMLLAGETGKVRTFAGSAKRLKFRDNGFAQPFNVEDAGWLLQILARLPATR